jgi:hypothetical protein
MSDLTNLIEWNQFAEDKKTVLEVLTILNKRHRDVCKERDEAREETSRAVRHRDEAWAEIAELKRELGEARELARELRDALEFMMEGGLEGPTPQAMRGAQDTLTKAKEAGL